MDSFKCDVCDKVFTTRSSLFKHGRSVHENISFVCSLCDKIFSRKDAMKRHKKAVFMKNSERLNVKFVFQNLPERLILPA